MLLRAAAELDLDLGRSALVGDKASDAQAGRAAGVGRVVLIRSGQPLPVETEALADHCCDDLAAAARWLCESASGNAALR